MNCRLVWSAPLGTRVCGGGGTSAALRKRRVNRRTDAHNVGPIRLKRQLVTHRALQITVRAHPYGERAHDQAFAWADTETSVTLFQFGNIAVDGDVHSAIMSVKAQYC